MWETGTRARPFCVVKSLIKKHLFVEVFLAFWGSNFYRWWVYRKPSTCLAKNPEFRLWMDWRQFPMIMFHSGHMHLLVYAIENDDCPVDAMSLEVVCFYLDTLEDDDCILSLKKHEHRACDAIGWSLRLLDHFPVQIDVCLEMRLEQQFQKLRTLWHQRSREIFTNDSVYFSRTHMEF